MDYSIRKKWLIAFWASWAIPILYALMSLNVNTILAVLTAIGITYYCAYRKYGTWLLTFLLILVYLAFGYVVFAIIIGLCLDNSYGSMLLGVLAYYFISPLDILASILNIYYYVYCYRLFKFNQLYRHRLFAEADKLL